MSRSISLAWAVAASMFLILGTIFEADIENSLWILSIFVHGAIACFALTVIVLLSKSVLSIPSSALHVAGVGLVIACWFASWIFAPALSTDLRFGLLRPYYEARLSDVRGGIAHDELVQTDGKLVAFYWVRGVTDNWIGLIHDPDDALSLAVSKKVFGGDMIQLHRLDKNWFLCTFT